MKISDIFHSREKTFSFEFFPPKDEISAVEFGINVGRLMKLDPTFVTVTYGAGGSNQERTFALVDYLQNSVGLTTVAHYTCVNASAEKVRQDLSHLESRGIRNVMLLRGDPPKGQAAFVPPEGGFNHANELIGFVRKNFSFCIAGAAYVDKHPEAASLDADICSLKAKFDAGADFLVTQLFFINENYFRFVRLAREAGITCRIIPGIIPLTAYHQLQRFTKMSAAKIPEELTERIEASRDNPEKVRDIGIEYTIKQCRDLLRNGAPGLHFYTLNRSRAVVEVFEELK